jgi:hypothetical protein
LITTRDRSTHRLAETTGAAVRRIGLGIPGTIGPLAVCVGLWMAWPPLGVIMLGLILWALDRRIP